MNKEIFVFIVGIIGYSNGFVILDPWTGRERVVAEHPLVPNAPEEPQPTEEIEPRSQPALLLPSDFTKDGYVENRIADKTNTLLPFLTRRADDSTSLVEDVTPNENRRIDDSEVVYKDVSEYLAADGSPIYKVFRKHPYGR